MNGSKCDSRCQTNPTKTLFIILKINFKSNWLLQN